MKFYKVFLCFVISHLFTSCGKESGSNIDNLIDYDLVNLQEVNYRPNFHFTPALHWMNDPNGLVYYKGQFHLFYQYNPNASVWGPMNWGHAISTDLFNWQDLPIALSPDNLGAIFSGSAVVDTTNTSGFKNGDEDPLVAIFTHAGAQQMQSIAYSNDGGVRWTKYSQNPVLANPGIADFRDPKVMWFDEQKKWIMTLATGNKVSFYSSPDLKNWTFESYFGENYGAHGGVWECPDLFQLPIEGTTRKKWVLLVSNFGGPNGGTATQYFVGNFDGHVFTTETTDVRWIDYGTDNYAGVTYSNLPASDGRRIFIGWMSNWIYAGQVPTTSWRSTMTVPRAITLAQQGNSYKLRFNPVVELEKYISQPDEPTILNTGSSIQLTDNDIIKSGSYNLSFSADFSKTDSLVLTTGNVAENLKIRFDKKQGNVLIDRSHSGITDFNDQFKQKIFSPMDFSGTNPVVKIRMLVDKTSVELFWNNGENVMTVLYFPKYQYNKLIIRGNPNAAIISNFSLK
ncbi:MAG: glycoside hydrolase family 32 protein, partial [Bacteroidota bacterium]|nr:glycoside hydrolase family 32 protein [Bacteroidota bacterium]